MLGETSSVKYIWQLVYKLVTIGCASRLNFYLETYLLWFISMTSPFQFAFEVEIPHLIKVNYPDMQDFEIHAVNKDTEKNVFPYQGPNQNI